MPKGFESIPNSLAVYCFPALPDQLRELYDLLSSDYQGLFSLCLKRTKREADHSFLSSGEEEACKLASRLSKSGIALANVTLLWVHTSAKSGVTLLPSTRAVMSHWLVGRVRECAVVVEVWLAQEQRRKRRKFCLIATCKPQDNTQSAWATRRAVFTGSWFWNWVMGEWVELKTRECVIKILKNYRNSSCLLRNFENFKPANIYCLLSNGTLYSGRWFTDSSVALNSTSWNTSCLQRCS